MKKAATKKAPAEKAPAKKTAVKTSAKPGKASNGSMNDESMLAEFFADELKDIYWAEKHLVKTLPKMKKAATSPKLQKAFEDHLAVTQTHVNRLEEVFGLLGKKAQAKKCDAMAGITEEGQGIIDETEKGTATRDVGLILAAQKVEHYEIATYGGLANLAKTLGYTKIAQILGTTLVEEKYADELLSQVAESSANERATKE